jgi:uncharacterized membrane protein YraQ (UPF0718 family)
VDYKDLLITFTSIIYEAMPFIVLGVVLAGLLEEFVPQQLLARVIPRGKALMVGAIALGALLGLIFPMCECGIIAVMRRLLRKGIPLSVCVSYMLAGPIINLVVMISTSVAFSATKDNVFGTPVMAVVLRCGMGYVVAVVAALVVEWQRRKYGLALLKPSLVAETQGVVADEDAPAKRKTLMMRVNNITATALSDFVDIMAFLVIGAALAATGRLLLEPLQRGAFLQDNPVVAILMMMGFAFVFCLCSEADAFVAANFQPVNAWPAAAKLAFLVLGPMLDIKLYLMYTRVFRMRLIWTIVLVVVAQVFVYCLLFHYFGQGIMEAGNKYFRAAESTESQPAAPK